MPITVKQLHTLADTFDWDAWNAKAKKVIEKHYKKIALEQAVTEAAREGWEFDLEDPFVDRFFTGYIAEDISGIGATTRQAVRDLITNAFHDGVDGLAQRLADGVTAAGVFAPSRALMIARTETAMAYGHGAGLAYKQNGIEEVEISDGDDDDECAAADGQIWTVDEYLAEPIAHPNCVRSAAPVLNEED